MFSTRKLNQKLRAMHESIEVKDLRAVEGVDDVLEKNPHVRDVTAYYVEIPLSQIQVYVPEVEKFKDRHQNSYSGGKFNAPLLTLTEWHDAYPKNSQPTLLINANWFNVWESGIPYNGEKMNLRQATRSYLIGLSVSDGKIISSHETLDQENVKLDSIVFNSRKKKAKLLFNDEIGKKLANNSGYFDGKNAVSGFILMREGKILPTPPKNNNHYNRLPRTGIGLKDDNKTAVVIVVHNQTWAHGVNAEEFANLFKLMGCENVINLDNSGSVELLYLGNNALGQPTPIHTKTSDVNNRCGQSFNLTERPKPNFLGFKIADKAKFYSYDDLDLNDEIVVSFPSPLTSNRF